MDNYTKLIEFTDEGLRTSTKPEKRARSQRDTT